MENHREDELNRRSVVRSSYGKHEVPSHPMGISMEEEDIKDD